MESIRKLFNFFSITKKDKPTKPLENLEVLKREFLEIDSRLSSTVLSPNEKKEASTKLHSLAIEIASILGGPDHIQVLAGVLKDKVREPPESLKNLLKNADLSILIEEFKDVHFVMLAAVNEDIQAKLEIRLNHVATEIANRLGGPEFFWALSAALQKNKAA